MKAGTKNCSLCLHPFFKNSWLVKIRLFWLLLLSLSSHAALQAQIYGTITDTNGEPLPFASIYLQGSSTGTTSNVDGAYQFDPGQGTFSLVYRYIGYRQKIVQADLGDQPVELNVVLEPEAVELSEVVVRANAEDPAYAIIRKAIKKRDYYRNLVEAYSCDVYIKGIQKLLDAPEKLFGQELGDLGGTLDSNRQGIIYLSESVAELHYQRPDQFKERMISSKVSGNDNGFSFNRATLMNFNFYDNHIEIERQLLSPIADNALAYYRYQLVGSMPDNEGRLINKIRVIPKRSEDPVFSGHLYIVEDLWNIHSTELILTGAAIKQPVLDTLLIKQLHLPVAEPDVWLQFSQTIDFRFALLGFKAHGIFTGIFSSYDIQKNFAEKYFNNELFRVDEQANEQSLSYWDSIRPVPLTLEEARDYTKKDSLQEIWKSKDFMDSLDRKNNRFKIWDLLFGYHYSNSYEKKYFSLGSPLTRIQFNTVQGFYGDLNITYRKEFDEYNMRYLSLNPRLQYGLADKQLRYRLALTYNFNRTNYRRLRLSGGRTTSQFNAAGPISPTLNTLYSLLERRNYLKVYDKYFGEVYCRQELWNGGLLATSVELADRRLLANQSDYSFYKQADRAYISNDPLGNEPGVPLFEPHKALLLNISLRLRIAQKYISYPGRKIIEGSQYPDLVIRYRRAFGINNSFVDYDLLRVNVRDQHTLGLFGRSEWDVQGGLFLTKGRIEFPDFQHFNGNQTLVSNPDKYLSSFLQLPYYQYSTTKKFVQAHFQHHFEGFLLDKLPALRKLGLKSVAGFSLLGVQDEQLYYELSFGLDNIGFKVLRLFRLDVVSSFRGGNYDKTGVVIGVRL